MIKRHLASSIKGLLALAFFGSVAMGANAAITASASVRGYHPDTKVTYISVTISNPMSVPADCRLEFTGYGDRSVGNEATLAVPTIPPGASRTVNVAVPIQNINNGIIVEDNGNRTQLGVSAARYGTPNYKGYLHVAEPANLLTDPQLDDFTYRLHPDAGSYGYHSGGTVTTRSLSAGDRNIGQAEVDTLPENWLCYVPVHRLIISDGAERALTAPQREAIDTWLAMGGTMMVYGGGDEETTDTRGGGGNVVRVNKNPVLDVDFTPNVNLAPFQLGANLASTSMPYREVRAGGRNGAFLLATLFLIVVGPINYYYFARRQQIRMLIVTVPIISLAFCSLIALYFVITQGFSRKGGSVSLTTVNEATNQAVTFARHSMLSGLYPLGGFRFNPQTYFIADTSADSRSGAQFDLTRETVLTNGLFQPGIPFNYSTVLPYTTRERMLYDQASGEVRNGFELPVKAVAVLNDGQFYRGGAAVPGAVAKLTAVDATETANLDGGAENASELKRLVQLLAKDLTTEELDAVGNMTYMLGKSVAESSGTMYAAILDGVPKTSDSGVEITEGKNLHLLVGRASDEGEATE